MGRLKDYWHDFIDMVGTDVLQYPKLLRMSTMATTVPLHGFSYHSAPMSIEQLKHFDHLIVGCGALLCVFIFFFCWTVFLARSKNRIINEIKTRPHTVSYCKIGQTIEGHRTYYVKFVNTHPLHTKGLIFMGSGVNQYLEDLISKQGIKVVA